jgi:hypothetical protein
MHRSASPFSPLVCLQTDNFRLFVRQPRYKKETNDNLPFGLRVKRSTGYGKWPWILFFVWCLHVSLSLFLHVTMSQSMSPCHHVSMSQVSMSPCLHVSMSLHVSPCLHVSMCPCPCLRVSGIPQTENGTNGKRQLPFIFCKWKRKADICFPLSTNDKR